MNIKKVASDTSDILRRHNHSLASQHYAIHKKENSLAHADWMLTSIAHGDIVGEKAHRWLGWAQALLSCHNVATLETLKAINKNSCDTGQKQAP